MSRPNGKPDFTVEYEEDGITLRYKDGTKLKFGPRECPTCSMESQDFGILLDDGVIDWECPNGHTWEHKINPDPVGVTDAHVEEGATTDAICGELIMGNECVEDPNHNSPHRTAFVTNSGMICHLAWEITEPIEEEEEE